MGGDINNYNGVIYSIFILMAVATMIYFKHKDLEDTYLFAKLSLWRLMIALIMDDIIASIN